MMNEQNLYVYAVFETEYGTRHKRLVCLFRTEKGAQGYAASLAESDELYHYVVERLVVSNC
jgi:hypothetical protein